LFNYADVVFAPGGGTSANNGGAASIGVQTGATDGVQYSFFQPSVTAGSAILFRTEPHSFQLDVQPAAQTALAGVGAVYTGTLKTKNGYGSTVGLSCVVASGAAPDTCVSNPLSLIPSVAGTS